MFASAEYQEAFTGNNWMLDAGISETLTYANPFDPTNRNPNTNTGAPTAIGNRSYTWNRGRLTKISYQGVAENIYSYNNEGIRIRKVIGTDIYNYVVEGNKVICYNKGSKYVYFNYDEKEKLIGFKYNGIDYIYIRDILGTINGIATLEGTIIVNYRYNSWGEIISREGNEELIEINPFLYKGYLYDEETNYYYCNSRYYNPKWGRWITSDDLEYLDPSSINGLNLYSYANNNPISIAHSSSSAGFDANGGMVSSIGSSVGGESMHGSGVDGSTSIPRNMTPVPRWIKTASSIAGPLTSFVGPIRTAIYAFTTTDLWDLMRLDGVDELHGILSKSMKIAGYGLAIFNAGIAGYEKYASGVSNISAFSGALINACIGIGSIHVSTLVGSFAVDLLSATALPGGWIILLSAGASFIAGTFVNHLLTKLEIGGNTIEEHLNNLVDWLIWWD